MPGFKREIRPSSSEVEGIGFYICVDRGPLDINEHFERSDAVEMTIITSPPSESEILPA